MKKNHLFFTALLLAVIIVMFTWQGCQMDDLSPVEPGLVNTTLSFTVKDSLTGDFLAGDSAFINQALLFIGTTTTPNVAYWKYTWGDASAPDTGRMAVHKYYSVGNYEICLKVYDSNWTLLNTTCRTFRIVSGTSYNAKPVFKKLGAVDLGGGNWSVTYGLARGAISCVIIQPFIVFAEITGWNPINLNPADTTADGYYRYTETVTNNTIRKFSYGGNFGANCYASIAPNPPFWSSYCYVAAEQKICVKWVNGEAMPTTTTGSDLPGLVGDIGSTPVLRIGLSSNGDTVKFYLNKNRVSGSQNNPFWVNTLLGMTNPQVIATAPGYSEWWLARTLRSSFPQNFIMQLKYGDNYGSNTNWAAISSSYFYNSQYQVLEFVVTQLGGDIIIIPKNGQKLFLH